MLRRITHVHPTVQEFDPPQNWLIVDGTDPSERPVWLEPQRSGREEIVGRIRYFGFGILVVATLAVLPVLLLMLPAEHHEDLSEPELAELLATSAVASDVAPVNSAGAQSYEPTGPLLTVDTAPSGAVILLDYDSVGTTPLRGHKLKPGVYVLSVRKEHFVPLDTVVFVDGTGMGSTLSIPLLPETQNGRLAEIREAPPPAAKPRNVDRVQTQDRSTSRDRAQAPDPGRSVQSVNASQGEAPEQKTNAEKSKSTIQSTPRAGTLVVLVKPWGSIYIDGNLYKRDTDIRYRTSLPAGVHRVRVEHPDLGVRESEVQIGADQPVEIVFDLLGK